MLRSTLTNFKVSLICLLYNRGMRILYVEDEQYLADAVIHVLNKSGISVDHAADGEEGLNLAVKPIYDAIVLDIMLPKLSGWDILRDLRERKIETPIIMLSALSQTEDKVKGLNLGADDYIVKPFSMMEMVSRVKAVLRRSQPQQVSKLLKVGGLVVNLDEHTVIADGVRVQLTYKEFELLRLFLSHPGMAYTREQLFTQVWNMDYMGDSRTLDMHIRTLRQKLGDYGRMIETVRNVGYRWEAGYDK